MFFLGALLLGALTGSLIAWKAKPVPQPREKPLAPPPPKK